MNMADAITQWNSRAASECRTMRRRQVGVRRLHRVGLVGVALAVRENTM